MTGIHYLLIVYMYAGGVLKCVQKENRQVSHGYTYWTGGDWGRNEKVRT